MEVESKAGTAFVEFGNYFVHSESIVDSMAVGGVEDSATDVAEEPHFDYARMWSVEIVH